jgi:Xaa-Pro aminopeptidase
MYAVKAYYQRPGACREDERGGTFMAGKRGAQMPPRIAKGEFRARQQRAAELASARGLQGLLAWGRGGGTQDRYADLYYLTNYYSQYPLAPDKQGWSARGHGALVLPVKGASTLIVDMPAFRDDLAVADDILYSEDVASAAAEALASSMPHGPIGIMGCEAMAWQWRDVLQAALGSRLVEADGLGRELRLLKSDAELEIMRAAGRLGIRAVVAVMDAAVPGASEADLAAAGIEVIVRSGGAYFGMGLSCGAHADSYGHSQPAAYDGRYILREGDMARVDLYGSVDGYLFDIARTCVVGGRPTDDQQAMLDAARQSVLAGLRKTGPGVPMSEVARACDQTLKVSEFARRGSSAPLTGFPWGHNLGLAFEAPWIEASSTTTMAPRMCLAIEKRLARAGVGGVSYEDNVIVTEDGCEVISASDDEAIP